MASKSTKMAAQPAKRPFPVTLLAILAGVAAVLAVIHALQALGIVPYVIGQVKVNTSLNLWNFLMWALMVYIWVWLIQMLWTMQPQAWLFLAVITTFNILLDFVNILSSTSTFSDFSLSFLVNGIILLYCLLPGTKRAFGVAK
jgi:hypothetical protein